jgi:hypothetical protein
MNLRFSRFYGELLFPNIRLGPVYCMKWIRGRAKKAEMGIIGIMATATRAS